MDSLYWYDLANYKELINISYIYRTHFLYFGIYLGFVSYVQFTYQRGCLYRLKSLGVRNNDMDITIDGQVYKLLENFKVMYNGFILSILKDRYLDIILNISFQISFLDVEGVVFPFTIPWNLLRLAIVSFLHALPFKSEVCN